MTVRLESLDLESASDDLLAASVAAALADVPSLAAQAHTGEIDPDLADTAA